MSATGTWADITAGHKLWLFLHVHGNGKYYVAAPGSLKLSSDGRWTGSIYEGATGPLTLWLVDLGPKSLHILNTDVYGQNNGFDRLRLASDATPLASVSFTVP